MHRWLHKRNIFIDKMKVLIWIFLLPLTYRTIFILFIRFFSFVRMIFYELFLINLFKVILILFYSPIIRCFSNINIFIYFLNIFVFYRYTFFVSFFSIGIIFLALFSIVVNFTMLTTVTIISNHIKFILHLHTRTRNNMHSFKLSHYLKEINFNFNLIICYFDIKK